MSKRANNWKARQMIEMRLEQAREAKAKGWVGARLYAVESALRWREVLFGREPQC